MAKNNRLDFGGNVYRNPDSGTMDPDNDCDPGTF